ncbi:MAG: TolC family protein [Vicinamibacterales bacterium]
MRFRACRSRLALALALALVSIDARAQAGATTDVALSLDEALSRAVTVSHRIAEARARGDAATAAIGSRHAATLPQVAAVGGYTRTNHIEEFGILMPNNQLRVIYPDIPDNYRARLDVQWPIYTSGRLQAIEQAARLDEAAAARDVDTTSVDVRLDTTRAFWNLVVARESERVVGESLARMGAHVRDVRNHFEAGLIPPNDVLSAEAQEARQRMLAVQARTAREMAEADLARLIGLEPGLRPIPGAVLEPPTVSGDLGALVTAARQARPERQALEQRIAAAGFRQRAAGAGRRPVVALAGGVDYARPNPRIFPRLGEWRESWDAGINVSWPVFDGGRTKAEVAEASAGVRALQSRLAELDSLIALEIRQRLSELDATRAALDAADAAIRAATEARRVVGERFTAGVASSTDVIDAQVAILQAQLDRTQAIASARLAEARLNRALGR